MSFIDFLVYSGEVLIFILLWFVALWGLYCLLFNVFDRYLSLPKTVSDPIASILMVPLLMQLFSTLKSDAAEYRSFIARGAPFGCIESQSWWYHKLGGFLLGKFTWGDRCTDWFVKSSGGYIWQSNPLRIALQVVMGMIRVVSVGMAELVGDSLAKLMGVLPAWVQILAVAAFFIMIPIMIFRYHLNVGVGIGWLRLLNFSVGPGSSNRQQSTNYQGDNRQGNFNEDSPGPRSGSLYPRLPSISPEKTQDKAVENRPSRDNLYPEFPSTSSESNENRTANTSGSSSKAPGDIGDATATVRNRLPTASFD